MDFLLHGLTTSKDVSAIEAAAAERGVEISNARITESPSLFPGFDFYITAFWRLHTCLQPAMSGVNWIPWTAIHMYADRYDIRGTDFYRFAHYIEMMDAAYRSWADEKRKQQEAKEGNDTKKGLDLSNVEMPKARW